MGKTDTGVHEPGAIDVANSPKYSGDKDWQVGAYGSNGMTHEPTKSGFSKQEKAKTGLTLREKL